MGQKRYIWLILSFSLFGFAERLSGQIPRGEPFIISDVLGPVIDLQERNTYGLFPEIEGFQSAAFFKLGEGSYLIKITRVDAGTGEEKTEYLQRSEETIRTIQQAVIRKKLREGDQRGVTLRPKRETGRVVPELLLGEVGLFAGGAGTMGLVVVSGDGEALEGGGSPLFNFTAIALGSLGCATGVWLVGSAGDQSGSFPAALLGSAAGILVGVLTNNEPLIFLLPPIGGTIGFNLTRKYEANTGVTRSLLDFRNHTGRMSYHLTAFPSPVSQNGSHAILGVAVQVQF